VTLVPRACLYAPVALGIIGCGPDGSAPILETPADPQAYPGVELHLPLGARDDNPGDLRFSYQAPELEGIYDRSAIRTYGGGSAEFDYTPVADDVGEHPFRFMVTDDYGLTDEGTVWIQVRAGGATPPIFREPVGAGTTFEADGDCLDVDVVVEDPDSTEVKLSEEPPYVGDATLRQSSGHAGLWNWCPPPGVMGSFALNLSADDGDHPPTTKSFVIVVR
jgi:hypothetical protein